jgi:hypothetical protein
LPLVNALLDTIHHAMVNDPDGGDDNDYEREISSFLEVQFEDGDVPAGEVADPLLDGLRRRSHVARPRA